MSQYTFDACRWLRSTAKMYHLKGQYDVSSTMRTIAEELEDTRADIAALKGIVKLLMACIEDAKRYPDMKDDFAEELEAAQAVLARIQGDR